MNARTLVVITCVFAVTATAANPKADRLARQALTLQKEGDVLWKRFVLEEHKLTGDELAELIKKYEKAADLYAEVLEIEERPLNGTLLILARRIAQSRMFETTRKQSSKPRPKPTPKPEPKADEPAPEPEPEPKPKPEPRKLAQWPELEEDVTTQRKGIRTLRTFLMNHYFANRKFPSLLTRCAVCNGTGRRRTNQLDRRRKIITIACPTCHETGAHLNVPAARKAFWLSMSPLHRSDAARKRAWDETLAAWTADPRKVPEFLKRLKIGAIGYHGLWAEATWEEQGYSATDRKKFTRTVTRRLLRAGKRWYLYDPATDEQFFTGADE